MVKLYEGGVYLLNGEELIEEKESARVEQITGRKISIEEARKNTIAYSILKAHNTSGNMEKLLKYVLTVWHPMTLHLSELFRRQLHREWNVFPCLTCLQTATIPCVP